MLAESVGLVGVEDLPERVGGDVSQGVAMILVVAAREYITVSGNYATRPEAEARL